MVCYGIFWSGQLRVTALRKKQMKFLCIVSPDGGPENDAVFIVCLECWVSFVQ